MSTPTEFQDHLQELFTPDDADGSIEAPAFEAEPTAKFDAEGMTPADQNEPSPSQRTPAPTPSAPPEASGLREEVVRLRRERAIDRQQQREFMANVQQTILAAMQPVDPEDLPPDPEEDVVGHLEYVIDQRLQPIADAVEEFRGDRATAQQAGQVHRLAQDMMSAQQEFAAVRPDYWDAYNHMRTLQQTRYARMGYDAATIRDEMNREEVQYVVENLRAGYTLQEIVGMVYQSALDLGYRPSAAQAQNGTGLGVQHAAQRVRAHLEQQPVVSLSQVPGSAGGRGEQVGLVTPEQFWNDGNFPPAERLRLLQDEEFAESMLRGQPAYLPE